MMEENNNTPRVSRSSKDGPTTITTTRSSNSRFTTVDDGGGDLIECSGKYCRSCTAGLIADCVALCCCPCAAVVHCFALAFVKAPWVVGRRCLGIGNKNKSKKNKGQKSKRKCCKRGHEDDDDDDDLDVVLERNKEGNLRVDTNVSRFGVGEMDSVTVSAGFEAEKVWLELYQIGHLDFGRASFSHD